MKTKLLCLAVLITAVVISVVSCSDEAFKVTPQPVNLDLSGSNQNPNFLLGKVLFYDTHLSVNGAISCATCHKQALAFSDNVQFSRGFENRLTSRNSPPIQNLANFFVNPAELFWDGRESNLNTMVLKPILNHVEMGMDDDEAIVERVRNLPYYHDLFFKAYGNSDVTSGGIANALATFVGSIFSTDTRFDRFMTHQGNLTAIELQGRNLFFDRYNCNSCHQTQEFNGYQIGGGFVNIGLDATYTDNGRGAITHDPADNGKFKIPNLRNAAITSPYMHDGRFATLNEVLNHYSHGIANHPNLDARLKGEDNLPLQLNISEQDKTALIAFLNTLTDFTMISDKEFSTPFKAQ